MNRITQSEVMSELPWFQRGSFPLYLAPMAGFTDVVFRELCKEQGADVMVTEFVMANKFLDERSRDSAWETIDFSLEQRPMGVQIFGSDPVKMAQAGQLIADRMQPDFIDINFGCPAPKVVENCAGSSLLKDLNLLEKVARTVADGLRGIVPVTAKIRIGWDDESVVAREACQRLESAGMAAIAIHGRTKMQGYRGNADWEVIEAAASAVSIPVVGNGAVEGIPLHQHLEGMITRGHVSGLMVGRAALGYPWIFREIKTYLETGDILPPPSLEERWETMLRYSRKLMERPANADRWNRLNWMRSRLKSFTKIIPGCRELRQELDQIITYEQLVELSERHLQAHQSE